MKATCERSWTNPPIEGTSRSRSLARLAFSGVMAGCALSMIAGCASVKPWDHDLLAEPAMRLDAYPLEARVDDHIYFSKEASSGGRSFAGGGCGCN